MIDELLVNDIARLNRITEPSQVRSLHGIIDLAVLNVPGCEAATLTIWRGSVHDHVAGSHPDVVRLVETQLHLGEGPVLDALRTREAVSCRDILSDHRWPRFRTAALRTGVRSMLAQVEPVGELVLTFTLWSVRANAFRDDEPTIGSLLAAQARTTVGNVARFELVQRTATQLQEAVASRSVIDQAKGVLMQALGCDAEAAFQRMRQESQRSNIKVVDVARQVLEAAADPAGDNRRLRPDAE